MLIMTSQNNSLAVVNRQLQQRGSSELSQNIVILEDCIIIFTPIKFLNTVRWEVNNDKLYVLEVVWIN